MQSLNIKVLCNALLTNSLNRTFKTSSCELVRHKKISKLPEDPGLRHQKAVHQEDPEFLDQLEDEELLEESNYAEIDKSYDDHYEELKKKKQKLANIITAKKFFEPKKEPSMLSFPEREYIKFLHNKDPVEWDIKTLSESFPATPSAISKILRTHWKPSPGRIIQMNKIVSENWKLLAEGKLDADPHVISHFKKFTNHRDVLLERVNNKEFYLPEIKKEKAWNSGEMSSILTKYEKAIEKLDKEHLKSLPHSNTPVELSSIQNLNKNVNSLQKIKENIKNNLDDSFKRDSFVIRDVVQKYQKPITIEKLENELINKAERGESLDMFEKVVLDDKFKWNVSNKDYISQRKEKVVVDSSENKKKIEKRKKDVKLHPKIFNYLTSVKLENKEFTKSDVTKTNSTEKLELEDFSKIHLSNSEIAEKEKMVSSDVQAEDENFEINVLDIKTTPEEKNQQNLERLEKDRLFYDKEVDSIKSTAFWNNGRSNQDKLLSETEKAPLEVPKEATETDVVKLVENYPERIKIPKNYRGTGLTFRVNDCYYDDDGEFLYRVPGVNK